MSLDLKAILAENLNQCAELWEKDLLAHRVDQITTRPTESARSIADIVYETAVVNRRIAARLKGETPPPMDGFPSCPAEIATAAGLAKELKDATAVVLAAAGDDLEREVVTPMGPESAFTYALFAGTHMMYHLGQINYIQTVYGDTDVHWLA